jgi:phage tail-like protein
MMTAFDDILAPIFSTMDCFDSYLDPQLAPPDFVDWLASWVGVDIDETWTLERRRQLIREAVVLYRIRGTAAGLAAHIGLYCGVTPEIEDSGGCEWSQAASSAMPGSPQPHLTVRLRVDDAGDVRRATVNRIVGASRPAHVPYELEILAGGAPVESPDESEPQPAADKAAPGAVDLPGSERIELAPQGPANQEELDAAAEGAGEDSEPTA